MIRNLLTKSSVDHVEQLREIRNRKRDHLMSIGSEKSMDKLKATLIKQKYSDMNLMSSAPSKQLA